jgi:AcrR family transcriptional regulator
MPIEVRREQVLDAALRLITDRGYGEVSMEAIARQAQLAKPVVYNAYPGLGPLLRALLEREETRGLQALAAAMPSQPADAGPGQMLLAWLRTLAEAIASNPGPWRLILIPPAETPVIVREHVQAGRDLALAQVRSLTGALLQQRPDQELDLELTAQSVFAAAEHAARLMVSDPERYPPARMVDFAETLLSAIGVASSDR